MNYTPYATLQDTEVVAEAYTKANPTSLELELAQRVEQLTDANEDLRNQLGTVGYVNRTQYKAA